MVVHVITGENLLNKVVAYYCSTVCTFKLALCLNTLHVLMYLLLLIS